ncbi:hypothetical protein MNBD_GAMMA10-3357 [hydrothermal vent metagenome]|uniref:LysM domain-containing protein n=1 Tax=hydrothermal vent metagenome TaxID=652676 RepID=A0A3B0XL97_9ZZZZ
MFNKNSRYLNIKTVTSRDRMGREVQAVKLRRLNATAGADFMVTDGDQLDVIARQQFTDAEKFWHIADANCELQASQLVKTTARIIKVPES